MSHKVLGKYLSDLNRDFIKYSETKLSQYSLTLNMWRCMIVIGNNTNCSLRDIAKSLNVDNALITRNIKKLEDLEIIKCTKKGTGGSVLSTYEYVYATDNEIGNKSDFKECRTNYETVCEMESSTGTALELNTYGKIYKAVHEGATKVQLKELQEIEGLNKIHIDLFEYLLTTQKDDDSIKSKYKYFIKTIENAIRDKIYTLHQYKEDQSKRFKTRNNEISNNNFNYMDNSQEDDFELLARLTRER